MLRTKFYFIFKSSSIICLLLIAGAFKFKLSCICLTSKVIGNVLCIVTAKILHHNCPATDKYNHPVLYTFINKTYFNGSIYRHDNVDCLTQLFQVNIYRYSVVFINRNLVHYCCILRKYFIINFNMI